MPMDEACASYLQHDYARSLKLLDSIPANARTVKADYYRALNLQALHRYAEARQEFSKVVVQKKDVRLALLARQGLVGLARLSKRNSFLAGNSKETKPDPYPPLKLDANGNAVDDKWKIQKDGFGGTGVNREGLPENWTFQKTRAGCGRH